MTGKQFCDKVQQIADRIGKTETAKVHSRGTISFVICGLSAVGRMHLNQETSVSEWYETGVNELESLANMMMNSDFNERTCQDVRSMEAELWHSIVPTKPENEDQ